MYLFWGHDFCYLFAGTIGNWKFYIIKTNRWAFFGTLHFDKTQKCIQKSIVLALSLISSLQGLKVVNKKGYIFWAAILTIFCHNRTFWRFLRANGIDPGSSDSKAAVLTTQPRPLLIETNKIWEVNLLCFDSYCDKKLSKTKYVFFRDTYFNVKLFL